MAKSNVQRRKRTGMFVYCSEDMKKRVEKARRFTNRTLSGYVAEALERQLAIDEPNMLRGKR